VDTIGSIGLAVVVFASTNIDDIFVLMLFFADRSFTPVQVVLGQYVGIGLLVGLSLMGALVALLVPPAAIGLLGLVPIALGIKKLLDLRRQGQLQDADQEGIPQSRVSLRFLIVSAVTVSNGGDNIGVYVPLFANSTRGEIILITFVFAVMVGIWCGIGYALVNSSFISEPIRRFGHRVLPFVLIGLGLYILAEAYL